MSVCSTKAKNKQPFNYTTTSDTNKPTKDEKQHIDRGAACARQSPDPAKGDRQHRRRNGRHQQSVRSKKSSDIWNNDLQQSEWHGKKPARKPVPNNLLRFKFEPRGRRTPQGPLERNSRNHRQHHHRKVFSKEEFLQANCQFIVAQNGDFTVHSVDPDIPVPWGNVEQVCVWTEEEWVCPICLYPPLAAKTTQCGHIYCWPCILHYLALDDKGHNYRKCPICNVAVSKDDLRSVIIKERPKVRTGDEVQMRLMRRSRGDLVPIFASDSESDPPLLPEDLDRKKIVPYAPLDVLHHIIEPELEQLKAQLSTENDELAKVFVSAAIEDCRKREADVIASLTTDGDYVDSLTTDCSDISQSELSPSSETSTEFDLIEAKTNAEAARLETTQRRNSRGEKKGKDFFYFYQCSDGRHLYLHGLNVKCLLREFGEFSKCPPVITGKIATIESFTMTEELRKRHRYLSHLPLSCEYSIAELELNGLLSDETLAEFKDSMQQRAKHRRRKENEENKILQRAEALEKRKNAQHSSSQWFGSAMHTPAMGSVSVLVMSSAPKPPPADSQSYNSIHQGTPKHEGLSELDNSAKMSFAQMLRSGDAVPPRSRVNRSVGQFEPPSSGPTISANAGNDSDDPDYVPPPTYQSAFQDAFTSALDSLKVTSSNNNVEDVQKVKGRKGRKGKKKQTLIFSTSAQLQHL